MLTDTRACAVKRARMFNSIQPVKDRQEDNASPLIRDRDPYFGASQVSDSAIYEEFGFVPSSILRMPDIKPAGAFGKFVIHDNEYQELQQQFNPSQYHQLQDRPFLLNPPPQDYQLQDHPSRFNPPQVLLQPTPPYELSSCPLSKPVMSAKLAIKRKLDIKTEKRNALKDLTNDQNLAASLRQNEFDDEAFKELEQMCDFFKETEYFDPSELLSMTGCSNSNNVPGSLEIKTQKRNEGDMYTPRLVRGKGPYREGYCELCNPGIWLKTKQSAYWYHMNFYHGISASTGRPYPPPVDVRQEVCVKFGGEQATQLQGKCEHCDQWIVLEHDLDVYGTNMANNSKEKTRNVTWWRHAQKCSPDKLDQGHNNIRKLRTKLDVRKTE